MVRTGLRILRQALAATMVWSVLGAPAAGAGMALLVRGSRFERGTGPRLALLL